MKIASLDKIKKKQFNATFNFWLCIKSKTNEILAETTIKKKMHSACSGCSYEYCQ